MHNYSHTVINYICNIPQNCSWVTNGCGSFPQRVPELLSLHPHENMLVELRSSLKRQELYPDSANSPRVEEQLANPTQITTQQHFFKIEQKSWIWNPKIIYRQLQCWIFFCQATSARASARIMAETDAGSICSFSVWYASWHGGKKSR